MEIALLIYFICAVVFFIATIRDKYIQITPVVMLMFIVASMFWPLFTIFYIFDRERDGA